MSDRRNTRSGSEPPLSLDECEAMVTGISKKKRTAQFSSSPEEQNSSGQPLPSTKQPRKRTKSQGDYDLIQVRNLFQPLAENDSSTNTSTDGEQTKNPLQLSGESVANMTVDLTGEDEESAPAVVNLASDDTEEEDAEAAKDKSTTPDNPQSTSSSDKDGDTTETEVSADDTDADDEEEETLPVSSELN